MKIKKVEDKPMVIHIKKNSRLHLHKKKKPESRKKAKSVSTTKERKRLHDGIRKKVEESGQSIKVRKESLRIMARAGIRAGVGQIEGGEKVKESIDLLTTISVPMVNSVSQGDSLYHRKQEGKRKKRIGRKKEESDTEYAASGIHVRKHSLEKKADKKKLKQNRGESSKKETNHNFGVNHVVRGKMIDSFLDKFQPEQEKEKDIITSAREAAKESALFLVKRAAAFLAPVFIGILSLVSVMGIIVVAILAVIYNSPLSIFFPLPDTGYETPRTVLSEHYREFNQQITSLEEQGYTITYQNCENGAPVSNFNDTLMLYMVKYGIGQAGYVMDDEGKKNLKKVFEEMNFCDRSSNATQIPAGESLGEVVTTGYCNCSLCCGKWAGGHTASGTVPKSDYTLAVDAYSPKVPMGTKIVMNGKTYKVEDTGDFARFGTDFDIYFGSHAEALAWGKRKVVAYLAEGNENTVEITVSGTMVHNLTYEDYIALNKLTEEQVDWLKSMMSGDVWDNYYAGAGGQAVADLAMTKIGCHYSQDRRYEEGYYDCSSLVQRLYKEVNINLPATAATQGRYCYDNAMIINKRDLKPGDLIFYSYEENGKFRNISHVAIYVGNGKMVHAANQSRGVVIDSLRTNNVVFYARPY